MAGLFTNIKFSNFDNAFSIVIMVIATSKRQKIDIFRIEGELVHIYVLTHCRLLGDEGSDYL